MHIYTSKGIIFRTLKYSETSIICDIYTREKGLRSFIISGVRSPKSGSKAAIYRPLNPVEIISYDGDAEKLARIKEISLYYHFSNINSHVVISSIAIFILELCRNSIKEREANIQLYDFIEFWLMYMDDIRHYHPNLHLIFMKDLSVHLGFGPMNNYSKANKYFDLMEGFFTPVKYNGAYCLGEEDSFQLHLLLNSDMDGSDNLQIGKSSRDNLTEHLLTYYKLHISGFKALNSPEVLRSVL